MRLYTRNDDNPFQFMYTRTAKAYDDTGARDFNEDEYDPLRLPTNAIVRVCGAIDVVTPPKQGEVTVHYVIDETVVAKQQPPDYNIGPRGTAETPNCRVVNALPVPCSGGCGHCAYVGGCPVQ
jgi:hypothetical protein